MKHMPERTCAGCRTKRPKHELLRLARTPEGGAEIDRLGRARGRGGYLCFQPACWQAGIHKHGLERALRTKLTPGGREELLRALATIGDEK